MVILLVDLQKKLKMVTDDKEYVHVNLCIVLLPFVLK